jgi:uncharacterized protein YggT (Ycf19 family)
MIVLDFIINCAALLLWLNWWSRGISGARAPGIALVSTLKRAEPARRDRWRSPLILISIVLLRTLAYWRFGPNIRWTPRLSLVAITVPFRTDSGGRMLLYSVLSLTVFFADFYFCALLISSLNRKMAVHDPWQTFFRGLLGPLDRLPAAAKLLLPFVVGVTFWMACGPLLSSAGVLVPVISFEQRLEQAILIGIAAWITWKYAIAAALVLHIITSHVYLGNASVWQFVSNTAQNLLRPLAPLPLRVSRFDFAPLFALAIVFAAAELIERWLPGLFARLSPG